MRDKNDSMPGLPNLLRIGAISQPRGTYRSSSAHCSLGMTRGSSTLRAASEPPWPLRIIDFPDYRNIESERDQVRQCLERLLPDARHIP